MGEEDAEKNLLNNMNNKHIQLLESLDPDCNELKHAYDACFNAWFTDKFLKGGHTGPTPCDEMLNAYSECVKTAMKTKKIDLNVLEVLETSKEKMKQ